MVVDIAHLNKCIGAGALAAFHRKDELVPNDCGVTWVEFMAPRLACPDSKDNFTHMMLVPMVARIVAAHNYPMYLDLTARIQMEPETGATDAWGFIFKELTK